MKHIILFIFLFCSCVAYGQDLIVTVSGDSLNCKITEVKTDAIFFRYDVGGNIVSLPMNQVASYKYDFYRNRSNVPAVAVSMRGRSELSVYFGGGLSSVNYKPEVGSRKSGIGGMFGIGYTWFVSGRWGIVTGMEASLYRAEYSNAGVFKDSINAMSGTLNSLGNDFVLLYEYQDYTEKQSALFLQIPVMAQFQTGRFFASAGIKIGIPIGGKYNITATDLTANGKFPEENQTYSDMVYRGMGNIGATSYSGKLDVNILYTGALEAGGQWFLGRTTNLYVGAWLDYGLNNLSKTGAIGIKKSLVEYDHNREVKYDQEYPDRVGSLKYNSIVDTVDKIGAMSVGLKVKLTYSL